MTRPKTGVCSQISPDIVDRFLQSFHHVKALYMQMMDLYVIFPICQGTLPWQRNNVAIMKQTDSTCILCRFSRWQHSFVSLLLASGQHCGAERAIG